MLLCKRPRQARPCCGFFWAQSHLADHRITGSKKNFISVALKKQPGRYFVPVHTYCSAVFEYYPQFACKSKFRLKNGSILWALRVFDRELYLHCLSFKAPKYTHYTCTHWNRPRENTSLCSSPWIYWTLKLNICLMHKRAPTPFLFNFLLLPAPLLCWSLSHAVPMERTLETGGIMGSNPTCPSPEIVCNPTLLAAEEIKRRQSDKSGQQQALGRFPEGTVTHFIHFILAQCICHQEKPSTKVY